MVPCMVFRSVTSRLHSENERGYISHRVQKPENLAYRSMPMPVEILGDRRMYMRKVLRYTGNFRNVSNTELDNMIIRQVGQGYVVETGDGYEFYVSGTKA